MPGKRGPKQKPSDSERKRLKKDINAKSNMNRFSSVSKLIVGQLKTLLSIETLAEILPIRRKTHLSQGIETNVQLAKFLLERYIRLM